MNHSPSNPSSEHSLSQAAASSPPPLEQYRQWMVEAMAVAASAEPEDVPVGALLLGPDGTVLAQGANRRERDCDATAHAEILVIREGGQALENWRLSDCTLVVTLEPCPMCAAALLQSRVGTLVFGAWDPLVGAAGSKENRFADSSVRVVGGVMEAECRQQLQDFFQHRRSGDMGDGERVKKY